MGKHAGRIGVSLAEVPFPPVLLHREEVLEVDRDPVGLLPVLLHDLENLPEYVGAREERANLELLCGTHGPVLLQAPQLRSRQGCVLAGDGHFDRVRGQRVM